MACCRIASSSVEPEALLLIPVGAPVLQHKQGRYGGGSQIDQSSMSKGEMYGRGEVLMQRLIQAVHIQEARVSTG
jgi:hypothetical protein